MLRSRSRSRLGLSITSRATNKTPSTGTNGCVAVARMFGHNIVIASRLTHTTFAVHESAMPSRVYPEGLRKWCLYVLTAVVPQLLSRRLGLLTKRRRQNRERTRLLISISKVHTEYNIQQSITRKKQHNIRWCSCALALLTLPRRELDSRPLRRT